MDAVDAAVLRFRRRIGPSAVFDADDARQEAAIRVWLAGGEPAAAYRGIIDALRRLMPGYRERRAMVLLPLADDYEGEHMDTPEAILIARETAALIEAGHDPRRVSKRVEVPLPPPPAPVCHADPLTQRLREEAFAASISYSQAMMSRITPHHQDTAP